MLFSLHARPRAHCAPGIPCALYFLGANGSCKTSGISCPGMRIYVGCHCEEQSDANRHCERSEAIHSQSNGDNGLLRRGACHRARIRATRWLLAMTVFDPIPLAKTKAWWPHPHMSSPGLTGRPSIAEALAMDAKGRSVLDAPPEPVIRPAKRPDRLAGHDERLSIQHPPAVGAVERECRNVDLESLAAVAHHLVAAGHEAGGGRKRHAAGVFEALAGRVHRLLAGVGDDDGVGPEILTLFDRRAFRQEVRFDGDLDLAGNGAVHADYAFEIVEHPSEKFRRNQIDRWPS